MGTDRVLEIKQGYCRDSIPSSLLTPVSVPIPSKLDRVAQTSTAPITSLGFKVLCVQH